MWLKLTDDVSTSPKLGGLSDADARALVFGLWAYCARRENGGRFTLEELPAMVYLTARRPRAVTPQQLSTYVERGLVDTPDGETFAIHDWADYQVKPDGTAERMRRYRERKAREDKPDDVT